MKLSWILAIFLIQVKYLPEISNNISWNTSIFPVQSGWRRVNWWLKLPLMLERLPIDQHLPPQAITVVPPGHEAEFLAPLPTNALWGIGPKTAARLSELGIHTIGDITRMPKQDLIKILGKFGEDLEKRALGIDDSPIHTSHEVKSVSNETTFSRDIADVQTLYETLHSLSESVGRRLRKKNLKGTTIKLKLRWSDFTTLTRQATSA